MAEIITENYIFGMYGKLTVFHNNIFRYLLQLTSRL